MAAKQKVKSRNWANEETCLIVDILVEAEYSFEACIEKRSHKRSANEEVYQDILKIFNSKLREAHFVEVNKKFFLVNRLMNIYRLILRSCKSNTIF